MNISFLISHVCSHAYEDAAPRKMEPSSQVVYLSLNGLWLFEAQCLSAAQTLSDYWTSTTGAKFLAANLRQVDLITPPAEI